MAKANSAYTRLVALKKRQAETRGNREAALFLIQEFVNHADAIERANIPASDRLTVRFLARAMREILQGKNPKAALCLDAEGRAPVPYERDLFIALRVFDEYEKLKKRAKEADGGAVRWAIREIARRSGLSMDTVRAAWQKHGGRKGVAALAGEIGFDPSTAKALRALSKKG